MEAAELGSIVAVTDITAAAATASNLPPLLED
jgi:hypothetical protein